MERTAGFDDSGTQPVSYRRDAPREWAYTFIVSRINPDGRKDERCRFRLHHADVQEIANLSEAR
jgi:hypothetical protein